MCFDKTLEKNIGNLLFHAKTGHQFLSVSFQFLPKNFIFVFMFIDGDVIANVLTISLENAKLKVTRASLKNNQYELIANRRHFSNNEKIFQT